MYKLKVRSNYVREVESPHGNALPYVYESDLDCDIIEGRLLMLVAIYAHTYNLGIAVLTISNILNYLHICHNNNHWKSTDNVATLDAGFKWFLDNDLMNADIDSLRKCALNQTIHVYPSDSLMNLDLDGGKDFEPYFQLYQKDVERIFNSNNKNMRKLFRVYCFVKSRLPNSQPYTWCVPIKEIVDGTGYTPNYVSKALHELCDIGVLHRVQLKRDSEKMPPYVYIADIKGWEKFLEQGVKELSGETIRIEKKAPDKPVPYPAPPQEKAPLNLDGDLREVLSQQIRDKEDLEAVAEYVRESGVLAILGTDDQRAMNKEIMKNMPAIKKELGITNISMDVQANSYVQDIVKARRMLDL